MAQKYVDSFGTRKVLTVDGESYDIFRLDLLEKAGFKNISRLPRITGLADTRASPHAKVWLFTTERPVKRQVMICGAAPGTRCP